MKAFTILLSVVQIVMLLQIVPAGAIEKGTAIIAQGVDANTLDPMKGTTNEEVSIWHHMYEKLLQPDDQGKLQVKLASSYKLINNTTWEFILKKGVKFHNGSLLTAKDVKFSLDRGRDPKTKNPMAIYLASIDRVEVVDDYTVRIITKEPNPLLPLQLGFVGFIVSAAYLEGKEEGFLNTYPMGTGPHKFVEWIKNERITLEAFKDYWGGEPKIKKLIFKPIPETSSRVASLQTGEVDVALGIPPFMVDQLKGDPKIQVKEMLTDRVIFISFDLVDKSKEVNPEITKILSQKKVRQAMNYAIDKEALIKTLFMGRAKPIGSPITVFDFGYDDSVKAYPYNPEKAKALLQEAGYPNGFEVTIHTPVGKYLQDKEVAEAVAGMLGKVGIRANIRTHEWGVYVRSMIATRDIPVHLIGWIARFDADVTLSAWFTKTSQFSNFWDPELEEMIVKAKKEMNPAARKAQYSRILKKIHEDAPWIFLYQPINIYGVRSRINWNPRADEFVIISESSLSE